MSVGETIRVSGFTPQQQEAISARGNLLVSAGAGTGKTRTLVARCLRLIADEGVSLENILMVTFTEAAAAEMRGRIRKELRELQSARPDDSHLAQQLALLDSARISTLHSFCLQLVREHFHALGLDPQFTVLDNRQTRPLMRAMLDELFERHYTDAGAKGRAVRALVRAVGGGTDNRVRQLVVRIHGYSQSLPDPAAWLDEQQRCFEQVEPVRWREWFLKAVADWRAEWVEPVAAFAGQARAVQLCHDALKSVPPQLSWNDAANVLRAIEAADNEKKNWPHGAKGKVRDPLKKFFNDAEFLVALLPDSLNHDPLAQDWEWTRHHMTALISLTREFTAEFSRAKREMGGLDFADLEQHALQLLRDPAVAAQWRERLTHLFVDEYQDINEAQDKIITSLSRDSSNGATGEGNRFLVGDVKQSIYRFRLARPKIFSEYGARWSKAGADGRRVALTGNFRSRAALLDFINPLFEGLMRPAVGGIAYEALEPAAPAERNALVAGSGDAPCVELHVIARAGDDSGNGSEEEEAGAESVHDLLAVEREARLIARRLQELKDGGHPVWDEQQKAFRPVRWSDMAVLLRSPAGRAEAFAMEFSKAKIPLVAARDGFFQSLEVSDLLNLLKLLDNPLQDVPLLAVLRSPLAGFSINELAEVRAHRISEKPFWTALVVFHRETAKENVSAPDSDAPVVSAWRKADLFLRQLAGWRELVRQASLSQCLEAALAQTHYEALLLAGERGEDRRANVHRLLDLARQFDPYQRQGLYRFLRFVEAQEEEELDLPPALPPAADAVRLMSIHKSKGLEFPVVALACLGSQFNEQDLHQPVLLSEEYGLCPRITPPDVDQSYPGLPHWLARRRELCELRGEELRVLYVGLTRARDLLVLAGTDHRKDTVLKWKSAPDGPIVTSRIVEARAHLDWLLQSLAHSTIEEHWTGEFTGQNKFLRWRIYETHDPVFANRTADASETVVTAADGLDAAAVEKVKANLAWQYPFASATAEPAKTSVSVLRRRQQDEAANEAKPLFQFKPRQRMVRDGVLSAAETGRAHHTFLQFVALDKVSGASELKAEAERLRDEGLLGEQELAALDLAALNHFWQSDLGQKILAQRKSVHREIPFTARFSPTELASAGLTSDLPSDEFIVVQGVADLAVILPKEIWIVDFKTDAVGESEVADRANLYGSQLKLYALALERIYGRSVTECALYFLSQRTMVSIEVPSGLPAHKW